MQSNNFSSRLEQTNQIISLTTQEVQSPGLFHGKMGLAIFNYNMSRYTNNNEYEKKAEELIDNVYHVLNSVNLTTDFENGLAGIGWGIEYLVANGFLEADTDEILEEVDNQIYKHLFFTEELPARIENGLLGYAIYFLARLESCQNKFLNDIIKDILIETVNKLTTSIDKNQLSFTEPAGFNILWDLPITLLVLGKLLKLGIHQNKIYQLIKELTPVVCTNLPIFHCNRAYMLLGINSVIDQIDQMNWTAHSILLKSNISLQDILTKEFADRNISVQNGLAGAMIVISQLYQQNILFEKEIWSSKILKSTVWEEFKTLEKPAPILQSLLGGLPGIFTSLTYNNRCIA
ncbi:MAG: lanthionine synthetase LanC family protein [Bacteroidota bacterium]